MAALMSRPTWEEMWRKPFDFRHEPKGKRMDDTENPPGFTPAPFPQVLSQAEAQLNKLDLPKNGRKKGRRGPRQPKPPKNKRDAAARRKASGLRVREAAVVASARRVGKSPLLAAGYDAKTALPVDLAMAMMACQGLTADEIKLVANVAQVLAAWPEESRTRVASALGRMFP